MGTEGEEEVVVAEAVVVNEIEEDLAGDLLLTMGGLVSVKINNSNNNSALLIHLSRIQTRELGDGGIEGGVMVVVVEVFGQIPQVVYLPLLASRYIN